jgi:uncharacterized lipoprotein YmbA
MHSVTLLVLGGCFSTSPTRFYVLPTLTDTGPPPAAVKREVTIGVGPVTLHPYLDRRQMVTRTSQAKLTMAEFDQWAAPLQDTVAHLLAENLALLIPTERVWTAPWPRAIAVDYQVLVDVTRFDGTTGGEVVLAARWGLMAADGKELLMRQSRFSTPTGGQDYEATATAMSQALGALSRDIATAIQTMAPPASTR